MSKHTRVMTVCSSFAIAFVASESLCAQQSPTIDLGASASALRFRYIGPVGNRIASVAGVTGDPNVYYAGAASGGIWKTVDAGIHWAPIFDNESISSVGALAVAPSNPNIVWAGTGEPWIRSHISIGNGLYKSTDAGRTWTHSGPDSASRTGRIVIDPANPDIVFVAAQGHSYGPEQERGVYRTTDGGQTWKQGALRRREHGRDRRRHAPDRLEDAVRRDVAARAPHVGTRERRHGERRLRHARRRRPLDEARGTRPADARDRESRTRDLALESEPRLRADRDGRRQSAARAADGQRRAVALRRRRRELESDQLRPRPRVPTAVLHAHGRRAGQSGRDVFPLRDVQPFDGRRIDAHTDGSRRRGRTRTRRRCAGSGGRTRRATGAGVHVARRRQPRHLDRSDESVAHGRRQRRRRAHLDDARPHLAARATCPIAQIYHVTVDNRVPYYVYGNKQDGPSYRGPSNSRSGGAISRSEWHAVQGGESGWATPDPVDPNLIWSTASGSGSRGGIVVRFDERTRTGQNVEVWPLSTGGHSAAEVEYRFVWDAPFTISPHDHNTIYTGSQFVHMSKDGGRSWRVISPDLTRNDKSKQQSSGGLTPDNIGVEYGDVVYAIAESRAQAGVIWAGTNDGLVQVTRDARQDVDERDGERPGHPAVGIRPPHRAVEVRRGLGLHHRRRAPGEQSRSVGLPHEGFRKDVEADRHRAFRTAS